MPTPSHQALLLRVLAWHNRHPLARRIKASQVHSIGEVRLPFACAQTPPDPTEPADLTLVSAFGLTLDAPSPAAPPVAEAAPSPPPPPPAIPAEPTAPVAPAAARAEDVEEGEAAIDMPTIDIELSEAPEAPEPTQSEPPFHSTLAEPLAAAATAASAAVASATSATPSTAPAASTSYAAPSAASQGALTSATPGAEPPHSPTQTQPTAPGPAPVDAARPPGRLQRWLAMIGLRRRAGAAPAQPLFSRSIVWPLSAAAIARWARRHGQTQPLLPADSRRRRVEIDGHKQAAAASKGMPALMHLHLLSATIVDGDRRMRVLISPKGAILGSRAYSRPRQATAAALLMASMLGAGLGLGGAGGAGGANVDGLQGGLASLSAAPHATANDATTAAAAPASTSASTSASASPTETHAAADSAAHAAASAPAATAAEIAPPAPSAQAALPSAPASAAPLSAAGATSAAAASVNETATATAAAAPPPASTPPRRPANQQAHASSPPVGAQAQAEARAATVATTAASDASLARVRPQLSDQDKRLAREQSAQLRASRQAAARQTQAAAKQANAPVYALVSRPSLQRDEAQRSLTLMQAARKRLPPSTTPAQTELVQNQGLWRAAWWPFDSLADAERARVLLGSRGQRAEVVAF